MTTLTLESAASVVDAPARPRKKIATVRTPFMKYNAESANGRIYIPPTCESIGASGTQKAADLNGPAVTCFVSHEAANGNVNTELVGGASRIWKEDITFWADIDIADTPAGRDMLALIEGGYMRSVSMRVQGVALMHDSNYPMPIVVAQEGVKPELLGIDFTTRPGLADTARIQQILYESRRTQETYTEEFPIDTVTIESKEEEVAPMATIPLYLQIITDVMSEALTADRQAHQKVHDHLAGVLDTAIAAKHGEESASLIGATQLSEEGRVIAQKHAVRLAAAHDESAKALGLTCEGAYNEALGIALDPDTDSGDGEPSSDQPQDTGEETATLPQGDDTMTPEEMLEALKAQGYTIEAPKTAEEKLAALEAKLAEQDAKFAALSESVTAATATATQRQTQAVTSESVSEGLQEEDIYEEGDYLAGDLKPANWKKLSNRRVPWPGNMHPEVALHELAPFMAHAMLDAQYAAQGRSLADYIKPYEQL